MYYHGLGRVCIHTDLHCIFGDLVTMHCHFYDAVINHVLTPKQSKAIKIHSEA